ncbi:MAG: aminotransferase class V-fold PLP-dependent enzyme [Bacilli bacterium]|nr:aminotransferase class V-fold PLP-dependent enzyme [Bacilli bacterium]
MIYLDYAASTPVDEEILANYCNVESKYFANITAMHMLGQKSNYMYEQISQDILKTLGLPDHEVIYTSGATEANNIGLFGIANKYSGGTIITTKVEHPSVAEVMQSLESRFNVIYLDINADGIIDIEEFKKAISKDTILVSIMWVNNVIGTIQPIKDIIKVMKDYPKAKLLVDATQGIGKIIPDFNLADVDMFTFSTHKIYSRLPFST